MSGNWAFNEEDCIFNLTIYRIDDRKNSSVILPNVEIDNVEITTDLYDIFPSVKILLKDPFAHVLPSFPDDGNSGIEVMYIRGENILRHDFIISNVVFMEHEVKSTVFEINAFSMFNNILDSKIEYSTAEDLKTPIEILDDILINVFTDKFYIQNKDILQPEIKFKYITPTESSLKDVIDYLFLNANNKNTGFYFIQFDIYSGKLIIINTNEVFSAKPTNFNSMLDMFSIFTSNSSFENVNYGTLMTKYGVGNEASRITEMSRNNFVNKRDQNELSYLSIDLSEYDHIQRKWTEIPYSHETNMGFLPRNEEVSDEMESLPLSPQLEQLSEFNVRKNFLQEPKTYFRHSKRLLEYFLYSNVVQINMRGIAQRTPGEQYFLEVDNVKQPLYKNLRGKYMISRLYHIFKIQSRLYVHDISLVRTEHEKLSGEEYDTE